MHYIIIQRLSWKQEENKKNKNGDRPAAQEPVLLSPFLAARIRGSGFADCE